MISTLLICVKVEFVPCGHRLVCELCCIRMKRCLKCQQAITEKRRLSDGKHAGSEVTPFAPTPAASTTPSNVSAGNKAPVPEREKMEFYSDVLYFITCSRIFSMYKFEKSPVRVKWPFIIRTFVLLKYSYSTVQYIRVTCTRNLLSTVIIIDVAHSWCAAHLRCAAWALSHARLMHACTGACTLFWFWCAKRLLPRARVCYALPIFIEAHSWRVPARVFFFSHLTELCRVPLRLVSALRFCACALLSALLFSELCSSVSSFPLLCTCLRLGYASCSSRSTPTVAIPIAAIYW